MRRNLPLMVNYSAFSRAITSLTECAPFLESWKCEKAAGPAPPRLGDRHLQVMETSWMTCGKLAIGNILAVFLFTASIVPSVLGADQIPPRDRDNLEVPLLRTARATPPQTHPLEPALKIARTGLETIRTNIQDYTCILIKRERIGAKLGDYEYMHAKVRTGRFANGQKIPFSVYMYFLKPAAIKGREVLYVEGQNGDKLVAHETGIKGKLFGTVDLKPDGPIAMMGQRYPITDVGIENLVLKLIERGERETKVGRNDCSVTFHPGAKINGRVCTLLRVMYNQPGPEIEFYKAEIFIDDELQVPIRYVAYDFPMKEGDQPPVLEEYTYVNLKLNVGLTDADFDRNNEQYNF